MPKLKTNRAAAKRFRKTAKGFKSLLRPTAATTSATSLARPSATLRSGGIEPRRTRPMSVARAAAALSQVSVRESQPWHESSVA